jgi:hypothetical protein
VCGGGMGRIVADHVAVLSRPCYIVEQ